MADSTAVQAGTSTWQLDPAHSSVEFSVKHMMMTTVRGRFKDVTATLTGDRDHPQAAGVEATIDAASIDTGVADRDAHLRGPDFFNAEQYPTATFRSTRVEPVDDEHAKIYGELTIRDVTRPVVLDVEYEGQGKDAYGNQRAGFTATTTINRLEYGLKWNPLLETGGAVVSDRVKLTLHIAAVKQG